MTLWEYEHVEKQDILENSYVILWGLCKIQETKYTKPKILKFLGYEAKSHAGPRNPGQPNGFK